MTLGDTTKFAHEFIPVHVQWQFIGFVQSSDRPVHESLPEQIRIVEPCPAVRWIGKLLHSLVLSQCMTQVPG